MTEEKESPAAAVTKPVGSKLARVGAYMKAHWKELLALTLMAIPAMFILFHKPSKAVAQSILTLPGAGDSAGGAATSTTIPPVTAGAGTATRPGATQSAPAPFPSRSGANQSGPRRRPGPQGPPDWLGGPPPSTGLPAGIVTAPWPGTRPRVAAPNTTGLRTPRTASPLTTTVKAIAAKVMPPAPTRKPAPQLPQKSTVSVPVFPGRSSGAQMVD